jgi:hypothetical protein
MPTPTKTRRPRTTKPAGTAATLGGPTTPRHTRYADEVWERAETRAALEGRAMHDVLRQLLADYAAGAP